VSRRLHPAAPSVVSIGAIHGGEASNVIPERVELAGTIRYMAPEIRTQVHAEIERALALARTMGGEFALEIERGYPPMDNDTDMAALLREVATGLLGAEHIHAPELNMGAEDFGFFSAVAPGAMFMLGSRIEGDERRHHDPRFDIDERCLPIGAAILAKAALRLLRRRNTKMEEREK